MSGLAALWTLTVRLALLGVGVSLGWLAGVLAAQLLPSPNLSEPPFQEVAMRHSSRVVRKVRQLPQWWTEDLTLTSAIATSPLPDVASPPPAQTAPPPATPNLDAVEQEAIASELSALGTELGALDNRLADLETKLGEPVSDAPLESRLQRLNRSLPGTAAPDPAANSPEAPTAGDSAAPAGVPTPDIDPLFQLARDRVTLPSSLLFMPGQAILTPSAERILDTLLADLSRYPGATLVVGSHSDSSGSAEDYRDLTFRQALAVQQYLESRMGEGYRWVPVGYGQTRPLIAGTSQAEQQRNQRIEIAIVPRR
ncbi:OmpA family protein [Pseudanabaena sp. FACHB-2040]|uniref:OmpA family protein n=1 Tax=Pseudanabaena sp. FACHB-2040 TaxID=2692859 RepID=UPI00168A2B42|nr:OmpA family protein [Pseudanabaena sp. FACHB-2040]